MHSVIQDRLEEYLDGKIRREFQAHLDECAECRLEVAEFDAISRALDVLREPQPYAVGPGFYARLSQQVEAQKKNSFWSVFSLNSEFGRRLAFASLMTLAILGSALISQESRHADDFVGPEAVIASHNSSVDHEFGADRDHMMVTLASYTQ